jgi:hypothetical protein
MGKTSSTNYFFYTIHTKSIINIASFIFCIFLQANALHYNQETVAFGTLDELFSGKELKVWSDTTVKIMAASFTYRNSGVSWQYKANRNIPCTLSVHDTLKLTINASYIRRSDTQVSDSIALTTNPGQFNYTQLNVTTFPHSLITANTVTGPVSDTAGKYLRFSRDSAYCTLHHKIYYAFDWGDGFRSPWVETRTAVHSWSVSRSYAVRSLVRCQEYLFSDTLKTFSVTITPVAINSIPGQYKSGFFTREVDGKPLAIDFSKSNITNPIDSDIVFPANHGYSFTARNGLISLGIKDSLLKIFTVNGCGSAFKDTSATCKDYKLKLDSIVGSLRIVSPLLMPDTIMHMDVGQVCLIKTTEDHFGILIKIGEYIGGIDREHFYWGYQSDGNRVLNPGVSTGLYNEKVCTKLNREPSIKFTQQGNTIYPVLHSIDSPGEISVFTCNGSQVYRRSFSSTETISADPIRLTNGVYFVLVKTNRGIVQRVLNLTIK